MTESVGLANQLRAIAGRTADMDDHITLHLAADALTAPRPTPSNEAVEAARRIVRESLNWWVADPEPDQRAFPHKDDAVAVARALLDLAKDQT
jgi:hypothetical protein